MGEIEAAYVESLESMVPGLVFRKILYALPEKKRTGLDLEDALESALENEKDPVSEYDYEKGFRAAWRRLNGREGE